MLSVALIGYGFAGKTFHAPLVRSVAGLSLDVVASSERAKVLADLPNVRVAENADAAIADATVDLVVIATPNVTHAPLAARALAAGKHVVVDKPFTVTLAEARDLERAARTEGRVLAVFHNRRWDADFLTASRLVRSGRLGRLVRVESRFDRFRPVVRDRWRERDEPGAGLWYDLGPHLVDQALRLFGPPEAIVADLMLQRDGARSADAFEATLRYDGLRVALGASSLAAAATPRFVLSGTRASYRKDGLDVQEAALKAGGSPADNGWGIDPREGRLTVGAAEGEPVIETIPNERGDYAAFYCGVRDAIVDGARVPVPASEAVAVARCIDAGIESSARRAAVPL